MILYRHNRKKINLKKTNKKKLKIKKRKKKLSAFCYKILKFLVKFKKKSNFFFIEKKKKFNFYKFFFYTLSLRDFFFNGYSLGYFKKGLSCFNYIYIFGKRINSLIFDVSINLFNLKASLLIMNNIIFQRGKVLYIDCLYYGNLKSNVSFFAKKSQQFYFDKPWLAGSLTNFRKFIYFILNIYYVLKKEVFFGLKRKKKKGLLKREKKKDKFITFLALYLKGVINLRQMPQIVLLFNCKNNEIPLLEASRLGLVLIGLLNLNINSTRFTYPIFSETLFSNILFAKLFCTSILKTQRKEILMFFRYNTQNLLKKQKKRLFLKKFLLLTDLHLFSMMFSKMVIFFKKFLDKKFINLKINNVLLSKSFLKFVNFFLFKFLRINLKKKSFFFNFLSKLKNEIFRYKKKSFIIYRKLLLLKFFNFKNISIIKKKLKKKRRFQRKKKRMKKNYLKTKFRKKTRYKYKTKKMYNQIFTTLEYDREGKGRKYIGKKKNFLRKFYRKKDNERKDNKIEDSYIENMLKLLEVQERIKIIKDKMKLEENTKGENKLTNKVEN